MNNWGIILLLFIKLFYTKFTLSFSFQHIPFGKAIDSHSYRQAGFPKFPLTFKAADTPGSCGGRHVYHSPPKNTPYEPTPKIVGGVPAPYGAYPWTVHIESLSFDGFEHACGGTIISENFIVTAAHCLHGYGYREIRVKVGDFDTEQKDFSEKTFETEAWRIHPEFQKGGTYSNDIAILKIKPFVGKGMQFNEHISSACLPSEHFTYPAGTWCYVSGWGLITSDSYYPSNLLRAASVPLISKEICQDNKVLGLKRLQPGMLCAGYLQGEIDACDGDSGGPLVCDVQGSFTLLGVVSWGIDCAKKNKPGIYSDVQYYLSFIKKAMEEL